ncbi:MAG: hypothetical protein HY288_03420 [Planctomycetia bacterium]|nr:hypothetical protein [Planctomycetia bacterium]
MTGTDDRIAAGNVSYLIVTDPITSLDPFYNGLDPPDVSVTNLEINHISIGGTASTSINDNQTASPFVGIVLSDPDSGESLSLSVTLSAAANGTLANLAGGSYDSATGVYTLSNVSLPAAQAALRGLLFTCAACCSPPRPTRWRPTRR